MANNDMWNTDATNHAFLIRQGANDREAVVAEGFYYGVPPWRIGEIANYGSGNSSDPEKQKQNWASAVSRAAKRGGQVITRIQVLIDALGHFLQHGEGPTLANEREILEKLSNVVRGSADTQVISAGKAILDSYRRDGGGKQVAVGEVLNMLVRKVGSERTLRGLKEFDAGHLIYAAPELFDEDNDDGKSGPDAGRVGDDARDINGGGLRRTGHDAAVEMDRGLKNAGGAGTSQRRDDGRGIDDRLETLEAQV